MKTTVKRKRRPRSIKVDHDDNDGDVTAASNGGNRRTIKTFVSLIKTAYQQNVEGILEIGRLLNEANYELDWGKFELMITTQLPFGPSMARKCRAVAEHSFLTNRSHVNSLPARLGTLYELSQLSDKVLADMLADGKRNPDIERKEVERIRKQVEYTGHYVYIELRDALNQMIKFAARWPDVAEMVASMNRDLKVHPISADEEDPELVDYRKLNEVSKWIAAFAAQCIAQRQESERREAEAEAQYEAERERRRSETEQRIKAVQERVDKSIATSDEDDDD
jgi:hypothetical protein